MTRRQPFACFLLKDQRLAGFHRQHGNTRRGAGFERLRAEAGDVKPHVMMGLGNFDSDRAAFVACQLAAAHETLVRAFESFHGEDGAVFHDNGLADFEPRDFFGDFESECDVGVLHGGRLWPKQEPVARHERLEPRRGFDEFHPVFLQFLRNGAKNGVGIFLLESEQKAHRAQVGSNFVKISGRNLASHDALFDAAFGEHSNHFRKLADLEPNDLVHERCEGRFRFALERHGDEPLDSQFAGLTREFNWQPAIAGDEAKRVENRVHSILSRGKA